MSYEKLTIEQQENIAKYRERYFIQAINCDPAERRRAETAAYKIGELSGVKIDKIYWVNNPTEITPLSESLWSLLRSSVSKSLNASLRESLSASLSESLWVSLSESLWVSLWESLRVSLWESLRESLSASLRESLWVSGWLCFYSYCVEVLGIEIDGTTREKLRLHNDIAASCFAIRIMPGAAILCERPQSVKIVNGKLVDIEWRRK